MGAPVPDEDMPTSIVPADDLPAAAAPAATPNAPDLSPTERYRKVYGTDPATQYALDEFMKQPAYYGEGAQRPDLAQGLSALTGLPKVASVMNPVTPVVAAVTGALNALPAVAGAAVQAPFNPSAASENLRTARDRFREGASYTYNLAQYLPSKLATARGNEAADTLNSLPANILKSVNDTSIRPWAGDAVADTLGEVGQDVGTLLPALGVKGVARDAVGAVTKGASAAKDFVKSEAASASGEAPADAAKAAATDATTPDLGKPVTGEQLRAQTNPIPPPEGTVAAANTPTAPAAAPNAEAGGTPVAGAPEIAAPGPSPAAAPEPPTTKTPNAPAERIFTSPEDEGPKETPNPDPAEQAARASSLAAADKLSGGQLPTRRTSARTGDYNATGNDWQMAKSGNETMQKQLGAESDAMHAAMKNVHDSTGSLQPDSVDPTTLGNRAQTVRGALQAIEQHFNGMTDAAYEAARANTGDAPMPQFLKRATAFLNDKANYMPDGFRQAALARLDQLRTVGDAGKVGDGSDAAAPGSVGAAEKFREWANANRTLDNMHTVRQLVEHTDTDVAEHGGPGLFQAARNMRTHQSQMLEQPTGIKKLLAPGDSQGINHAIPEHKVMDYINGLDRQQHEHVMNVLRAGAHLSPEIAEQSAAAIRELQAHTVSRLHDAATNDGGKWNARDFYNATSQYARNAASTFRDNPIALQNLKTINDAGNTLHMDKSYPGAAGSAVRSGALASAAGLVGRGVASAAHEIIPVFGRMVGRAIEHGTETATGEMGERSARSAALARLVDRNGNKMRGSVRIMNGPGEESAFDALARKVPGAAAVGQATPKREETAPPVRLSGSPQGVTAYSENGHTSGVWRGNDLHITDTKTAEGARGNGEGTARLEELAKLPHAKGGKLVSDHEVSAPQQPLYEKGLAGRGYDVQTNKHTTDPGTLVKKSTSELKGVYEVGPKKVNVPESQRGSVKVMNEAPPEEGTGSQLNIGLHQGTEGEPGFKKMSKQEAQKAVESTGAKVTKNTVLTPQQHGVSEPTSVMSTDRPLSNEEMQSVLAKTKQSAIPQRADNGDESMHIAPGHEATAKEQGWDSFNPDYFREHSGQTATDAMANPKSIHPDTTVRGSLRSAYPGIYADPKEIVKKVQTVPESPHLKDIFDTTRQKMHDEVVERGDVEPKTPMPGMAPKGKGSAAAQQITTPENAARIRDTIAAFKDVHPEAYKGMVGWYHMDPMYKSIKKILGGDDERASDVFHKLNTYTSLASPMSSVGPEIVRGTAAATMAAEGKFGKFEQFGGNPTAKTALKKAPELASAPLGMEGHPFHGTAQAPAMSRFNESGQEANAPKTGAYRRASDAPSRKGSEYQNTVLVGDSHFSRGAGLADVRAAKAYDVSIEGPELKTVHPWYHENVARPSGIPATSAQAAQWAALSHETGVETPIGAPKLEIWADQIAKAAKQAGVEPKEMWERIVKRLAK